MSVTTKRGPGRPPDLEKRRDVLDATRSLLADVGYSSLTIDGVAQHAGTARSYVYRVWESKMALVEEALFEPLEGLEVPDTGSTMDDLRQWVALHVAVMDRPAHVKGLPGLTIELMSDPDAYRATYRRYVKPTEDGFTVILDRARTRGEGVGEVDGATVSRVMSGTAMQLAHVPGNDTDAIVDVVMATLVGGVVGI
ncbi:MAG TPA: TetR/AcrR family transcriptional regulator [Acidimicrobiales bacterium]|nr:TetR/AcrR family transcriptional regulator [Acidimicrobiales bacterium]